MHCTIRSRDVVMEVSPERLGINTCVFKSAHRPRYGEEVQLRLGFVDVPATVRWWTEEGFGVQVGSLPPRAVWGLHRLGIGRAA